MLSSIHLLRPCVHSLRPSSILGRTRRSSFHSVTLRQAGIARNKYCNFHQITRRSIRTHHQNEETKQKKRIIFWIGKGLKIIRIPFIVMSVFGLGYNSGISEYARNPEKKKLMLLQQVVKSYGCDDMANVSIAREGQYIVNSSFKSAYAEDTSRDAQLRKITVVGQRVVNSAKDYVNERLLEISNYYLEQGMTPEEVEEQEDFIKWYEAKERMGYHQSAFPETKWHFILVESEIPNACVTELLPCTIFVTTKLLNTFTTNDDELGLILGHEVSHLIHGHGSEKLDTEAFLKTMEILLLSLDPTEGILSVGVVAMISFLHSLLSASYSRHHELEADETGMKIAARACFDTRIAPLTFKKMHEHHLDKNGDIYESTDTDRRNLSDFLSTHPPSLDRFENMTEVSEEENPEKYSDTHCSQVRSKFLQSIGLEKMQRRTEE